VPPGHLPGHFFTTDYTDGHGYAHEKDLFLSTYLRLSVFICGSQATMPRWLKFLIALALGVAAGLVYGWVVSPVQYVDTAPESLRADYRADYVLMAAEVYHVDHDLDAAARRLTIFGSTPPAGIATQALTYAFQNKFPDADLRLLQELSAALQTWQPAGGAP